MPFSFDPSNPTNNSNINAFPANERASRLSIQLAYLEEHDEGTGFHKFPQGDDGVRDLISGPIEGQLFLRTDVANPGIDGYISAAWTQVATLIPAGTVATFIQTAAPDGWSFDGLLGDKLLKLVNVEASGAGTAGDWDFIGVEPASDLTVDDHVLTVAEIPAHTHDLVTDSILAGTGGVHVSNNNAISTVTTDPTGGGGGHSHPTSYTLPFLDNSLNWRPTHVNVINCSKD